MWRDKNVLERPCFLKAKVNARDKKDDRGDSRNKAYLEHISNIPGYKKLSPHQVYQYICIQSKISKEDRDALQKRFLGEEKLLTKTNIYEAVGIYYAEKQLGIQGIRRGSSPSWDFEVQDSKPLEKWDIKTPMIPNYLKISLKEEEITNQIALEEAASIARKQKEKHHLQDIRGDIKIILDTSYITVNIEHKIFDYLKNDYGYTAENLNTIKVINYANYAKD